MLSVRFSALCLLSGLAILACGGERPPSQLGSDRIPSAESSADTTVKRTQFLRPRILPANRISLYDKIIKKYSRRYGFDWRLIAAQIYAESRFNPNARSHRGAIGLMQIMPQTARHLGAEVELLVKPEINIGLGTFYDRRLYNIWEKEEGIHRLAFMLASYNAGHRKVLRAQKRAKRPTTWEGIRRHLPGQTRHYVTKIFRQYEYYKKRYF